MKKFEHFGLWESGIFIINLNFLARRLRHVPLRRGLHLANPFKNGHKNGLCRRQDVCYIIAHNS